MTTEQTLDRPSGDRAPGGSGTGAVTGAGAPEPAAPASTASSRRAYARRQKRREKMSAPRMVTPGKPVASALNRAPFVVVLIAILGGGIAAVLWLNTLTDEAGMRTSTARNSSTDLRLTIEALQRDVANLDSTPRIADDAAALGMVPVGDAAMLVIDGTGAGSVIGTPSAVPGPPPPAAVTPAVTPAPDAAAAPAPAAPATPAATAAPAPAAPAAPAVRRRAPRTRAVRRPTRTPAPARSRSSARTTPAPAESHAPAGEDYFFFVVVCFGVVLVGVVVGATGFVISVAL